MKSNLTLIGKGYFELRTKNGKVIDSWETKNTVVTTGKDAVADLLGGLSSADFKNIAIGEGTTGAVVGDTTLESEVTRALASVSKPATSQVAFEKTFEFGSGESYAITEAGLVDSLVVLGSTLFDRFTFSAKNVDADIDLYVKITISVA